MKSWILPTVLLACPLAAQEPAPSALADNQCIACHKDPTTLRQQPKLLGHLFEHWYGSVHGQHQVGCESCHGGDAAQTDQTKAHQGVEPSSLATSKVYYRNLPETCGSCHQEVVQQFQRSDHFVNLKADRLAPTCTTCHGFAMEIGNVAPKEIAARCAVCHNKRMNVHPEVEDQLGEVVAAIADAKETVQLATTTVKLAKEEGLPMDKPAADLRDATTRLRATGSLWHHFAIASFEAELKQIKQLAESARQVARDALLSR